jgi:adenylate cyclase class IV
MFINKYIRFFWPFYIRPDIKGPKKSDVLIYEHAPSSVIKELLTRAYGVKAIVDKVRKIYFIDNVKFHFDNVKSLGTFIEVEAIDLKGELGLERIKEQCNYYASLFNVQEYDYIGLSYSDMVLSANPVEERIKLSGITIPV